MSSWVWHYSSNIVYWRIKSTVWISAIFLIRRDKSGCWESLLLTIKLLHCGKIHFLMFSFEPPQISQAKHTQIHGVKLQSKICPRGSNHSYSCKICKIHMHEFASLWVFYLFFTWARTKKLWVKSSDQTLFFYDFKYVDMKTMLAEAV